MESATRNFRGELAFAQRNKLNHVTRTVKTLSPQREDNGTKQSRQAIDPRWDPYSGEITSSDKGKPQSVKPKTFGIALRHVDGVKGKKGDLKTPTPVGERIRKLNSHKSSETLEVKDSLYTNSSATSSISKFETFSTDSLPSHEVLPQTSASPLHLSSVKSPAIRTPVIKAPTDSAEKSPQVTESVGNFNPSSAAAKSTSEVPSGSDSGKNVGTFTQTGESDGTDNKNYIQPVRNAGITITKSNRFSPNADLADDMHLSQNAIGKSHVSANLGKPSPPPAAELKFHKNHLQSSPINLGNTDNMVQPHRPSHINTNMSADSHLKGPSSSNDTLEESLIKNRVLAQQESVVMNRLRPKETASKFHRISRKSVPLSSPIFISMSTPSTLDAKERHLMAKSLPQTPAENSSNDLVTGLQAHLDNLAHRRRNITLSIRQMTELMPRDNLLITDEVRIKREHEKKKIAMLREEEAELKREEHEVGLRLHRAWKRTESGAVYEPTSLWVRRVTGVGKNWCWPNQDLPVF